MNHTEGIFTRMTRYFAVLLVSAAACVGMAFSLEVSTAEAAETEIVQVSLASQFSAVVMSDGSLWMWGANGLGQLGDGTMENHSTPVKVMDDVVQVSLGHFHSAAIKSDGSLWTWGSNAQGQLGDGTREGRSTPVKVMDDVVQVSLSGYHSSAIKSDGSLWMWGRNNYGQLGDGTKEDRVNPVKVMDDVIQVEEGQWHSSAITSDGSLWMWGANYHGQLGNGTKKDSLTPIKIMDGVAQVSLGEVDSAALKSDGSLWMWGYNATGSLGDGTREDRWSPVRVMDGVVQISLGDQHSSAITPDGSLWMWGWNCDGQLGDGTKEDCLTPMRVMGGVSQAALSQVGSAVLRYDGSLLTWGANWSGILGDGTEERVRLIPKAIFQDGEWLAGGATQASVSRATIRPIPDQAYTGAAITPAPTVVLDGKTLVAGVDYTVDYADNIAVGRATVSITGLGDYFGTKTTTFTISNVSGGSASWTRLAGDNAFKTMSAVIDKGGFAKGGTVVLASLEGYWDALTAAGIAGLEGAPVVMSTPDGLSLEAKSQLSRLAPELIVVCGGEYWLPNAVVAQAKALAGTSPDVVRLAGDNAAATAEKIAAEGKGRWSDTAIVATAGTFQDALAAAPVAYANGMPIFLAQFDFAKEKGYISQATIKAMKNVGIKQCYIAGGTYWLPKSVSDDLRAAGIAVVDQLGGKTAVETSGLIAQMAIDKYSMSADNMGAANVAQHYDALASASFCGKKGSVLVLVKDAKSSVISGFVKSHAADISQGYVFGGTGSVSDASMKALQATTK